MRLQNVLYLFAFLFAWCAALAAQTVRLANHGPVPFEGWVRSTIDRLPPHASGRVGAARFVLGDACGRDVHAIDVWATLPAGGRLELDLSEGVAAPHAIGALPQDLLGWFGGALKLNGQPLHLVEVAVDGAAWTAHLRARVGRMLCQDVWLRHYPGEAWAHGEFAVTASDPTVPDVHADVAAQRLTFGDGVVLPVGRHFFQPIVSPSRFADGQARIIPFVIVWPRHLDTPAEHRSVQAVASLAIGAVGIEKLLPDGNPLYPAGFDPMRWAGEKLPGAVARLHDWGYPVVGIAPNSTQTGSQEDQVFVRGEPMLPGGVGAEWVAYLSALKYANRPCHHLEADGEHLRLQQHPELVFWHSRAHHRKDVSPDQLGKERPIAPWDVPGEWFGADREHWLVGTLSAGARYTASPALQWELEHQARSFLLQETIDPRLSTSGPDAARSVGYAGIVAVQLWNNLADRELAQLVRQRFRQRVVKVYVPQLGSKPGDVWDPRKDDRILGDFDKGREKRYTRGVMWWQQAFGAYGLDLACTEFDIPEGRAMALRAAKAVLAHAYRRQGGRWVEWDNTAFTDGTPLPDVEMAEGKGAHRTGWFVVEWFPCAISVLLRHEPQHEQARAIWEQMHNDAKAGRMSWFAPGVPTQGRR
ncbi:MAG: hypothetical protein ACE37K_11260 [Planctomycetota bacterium]